MTALQLILTGLTALVVLLIAGGVRAKTTDQPGVSNALLGFCIIALPILVPCTLAAWGVISWR